MARVLIGWELGANRGHLVRMMRYRRALLEAGHDVALASQRIDGVAAEGGGHGVWLWQAPLWPRLLAWAATIGTTAPATMGDILARLGLEEPGVLASLVRGWESILAAERPDVVVGEYAPALLTAAGGRIPTIAIGNGFDLPPATMDRFPSLTQAAPVVDEAALLATANADLAGIGRPPLSALPALFAADRAFPAGLDEMDPYRAQRQGGMTAPMIDQPLPPLAAAEGDELFVYWPERAPAVPGLLPALVRSGLTVRVHIPRLAEGQAAELRAAGLRVATEPVPFADIVRRSRLLMSHGGGGFVMEGLVRGRPQVALHFDLEKRNNGLAIDGLGLGAQMPAGPFDVDAFAAGLRTLHADAALAARALSAAEAFRARMTITAEALMLRAVEELAG